MIDRRSKEYIKNTSLKEQPRSPIKAIRKKCVECMGGDSKAIDECSSVTCTLWPFRYGKNPFREVSEAQVQRGKELAKVRHD